MNQIPVTTDLLVEVENAELNHSSIRAEIDQKLAQIQSENNYISTLRLLSDINVLAKKTTILYTQIYSLIQIFDSLLSDASTNRAESEQLPILERHKIFSKVGLFMSHLLEMENLQLAPEKRRILYNMIPSIIKAYNEDEGMLVTLRSEANTRAEANPREAIDTRANSAIIAIEFYRTVFIKMLKFIDIDALESDLSDQKIVLQSNTITDEVAAADVTETAEADAIPVDTREEASTAA